MSGNLVDAAILSPAPDVDFAAATPLPRGRYSASLTRLGVYAVQLALDLVAITLTVATAAYLLNDAAILITDFIFMAIGIPVFLLANFYTRTYSITAMHSYHIAAMRVVHGWLVTLAILLLVAFTSKESEEFSRSVFLVSGAAAPVVFIISRYFVVRWVKTRLIRRFTCELLIEDGVRVSHLDGFDRIDPQAMNLEPNIDDPHSLNSFSHLVNNYDRVVVACAPDRRVAWSLYLQSVGCVGELLIPELEGIALVSSRRAPRFPTVQVSVGALDLPNRILKRMFDLSITVPLLIVLSPLLLVVAITIALDSRGPILFRQQRMGRNNRLFEVYKFRSMRNEMTDHSGARSASRDDDRITRVGRLIRATSIDELPQLFNVLQGDMALIGPRPHALGSRAGDELFWQVDHRYWLRHSIKPGITGLAQVRGYRGATDHRDDLANRLRSDLEYLTDWSIFRDVMILFRTIGVVVHRKAY